MTKTAHYPIKFREKFIQDMLDYEGTFREYCSRFGISHETGYDWRRRFEAEGKAGLEPRLSTPLTLPHATSMVVEELLIAARRRHPSWGPRKLKSWLLKRHPSVELPASSTIGDILKRAGMVTPRRRRRRGYPSPTPFAPCDAPNDVWTIDFKGQFRTQDGVSCYPLTLADGFSRYLLRCDGYAHPTEDVARRSLEAAFREYGLPRVIHSDNGTPFSSRSLGGLSRLSVWWVHLGIVPERSKPARPSDNGRHERMHRTLKAEATVPPQAHLGAQQRVFDAFRQEYNEIRPHEALGQEPPASCYSASPRPYPRRLPEIEYSHQHEVRTVSPSGHVKWAGKPLFLSSMLAGEAIGFLQVHDGIWRVYLGPV